VLHDVLKWFDRGDPEQSRWGAGRLNIEWSAVGVSVVLHGMLLLTLAMVGYAANSEGRTVLEGRIVDTTLPTLERSGFQDLDQDGERPSQQPAAGTSAPNVSTMAITVPATSGTSAAAAVDVAPARAPAPTELASIDVRRATEAAVPTAAMLGESVSIKGNGAEHVGGVEGAVDRIADEILRRLEKGRTLVIWAFDASGSLQAERQRLSKHIETIYAHIKQLDEEGLASDDGLLTVVVSFGHDRKALTPLPTADPAAIISAIDSVALDTTGVESTFQTVTEISRRWGRYRDDEGHVYHPMIIVVTDEVGDDEPRLVDAIAAANAAKTPVYVLGSQALFGRVEGYMNYTDPKTKQTYYNLPVRQGPESVALEQIRLPFWYEGPQYEALDAGFGPYALSRLAGDTGGVYFVTRMGPGRISFDPGRMREYKPDWVGKDQYEASLHRHPIRQAVLRAAQITQQKLPGQPSLTFPAVDGPEFKEAMARNQEIAARTAYTVDAALEPIAAVAKLRDREDSRRWQAHYDLIRGRLLAMKIRCYEYNWACAKMKKDMPKFKDPGSNAWRLVPDEEIHYNEKAAVAAKEARSLLQRVVGSHPGTPWALLAERELKDALGFRWTETYVKPIVRTESEAAAAKKKAMSKPAPKAAELPKL